MFRKDAKLDLRNGAQGDAACGPFINEALGGQYPADVPIVQFSNEHEGPDGSTVSGLVFRVQDKIYHAECQSTPDADTVVRTIEYDFAIALEGAHSAGSCSISAF